MDVDDAKPVADPPLRKRGKRGGKKFRGGRRHKAVLVLYHKDKAERRRAALDVIDDDVADLSILVAEAITTPSPDQAASLVAAHVGAASAAAPVGAASAAAPGGAASAEAPGGAAAAPAAAGGASSAAAPGGVG